MPGNVLDVWFAATLIAVWAYRGFHRPYTTEAVRYATEAGRYALGLFVFVSAVLALYVALLALVWMATGVLQQGWSFLGQPRFKPWIWTIDVLLSALLLVVFLPITRLDQALRRCAWLLAGFPKAAEDVANAMVRSIGPQDPSVLAALDGELSHYDVAAADVGAGLSNRVQAVLCEVQLVHDRFELLMARRPRSARFGAEFDRFLRSRSKIIERLDLEHARLLRRTARAVLFVRDQRIERRDAYPIADLLGEEALRLLADYRLVVAEASLSSVSRRLRAGFLQSFGYTAVDLTTVPIWPVAAVFVLDAGMFFFGFWALMFVLTTLGVIEAPAAPPAPPGAALVAIVVLHALGQAMAVAWAIYPKSITNFARPGIRSWPIGSYALFGFGSYCTGVFISWIAFKLLTLPMTFAAFVFGGSVFFAVVTVVISVLIDWRLRACGLTNRLFSMRDGLITAAACLGFDELFRHVVSGLLHEPFPTRETALLLGPLGFVLGSFLPGVAYAYLARDRTSDDSELGPRPSSGLPQEAALHEVAT